MSEEALTEEMTRRCGGLSQGRHLIVVQDTSSFNLGHHYYRLKKDSGIGPIEDNYHPGFFMHASLVMDAFTDTVLGCSDVQLWHRTYDDPERKSKTKYLPIEQKESFKWISACRHTKARLPAAASLTLVEDRDGDIYEQFATVHDETTHFVVHSRHDRKLAEGTKLYSSVHEQPLCGRYSV